jgi:hypothetical protein
MIIPPQGGATHTHALARPRAYSFFPTTDNEIRDTEEWLISPEKATAAQEDSHPGVSLTFTGQCCFSGCSIDLYESRSLPMLLR